MGKRAATKRTAVNPFRAGIQQRSSRLRRAVDQASAYSRADALERLESRVLMSATSPESSGMGPIVNVLWHGQQEQAVEHQFIAQTARPDYFYALSQQAGFTDIRTLGRTGYYRFTSDRSPAAIAKLSAAYPRALPLVQPNFVVRAADTFPSDPLAVQQWHLSNTGQIEAYDYNRDGIVTPDLTHPSPPAPNENQAGFPGLDINARKAWDLTTGSADVVVAVLDTGLDLTHPDLIANTFTNPTDATADGIDDDNNGFIDDAHGWNFVTNSPDVTDDNGHGTHVSGIIGAVGNNSLGVAGVNWSVKLLPVKVLNAAGFGSTDVIIAGVNYVTSLKDQGVNIVVMNESLGGPNFPFDVIGSNAIREAGRAGILDVAAAGNSSSNNDRVPVNPAVFSLSLPNVITVAAVDNQGKLAAFSNFGGSSVDLAAPGVNIQSTAPTYPVTLTFGGQPIGAPQFDLSYGFLSGTSQAAPQVAGIIALEAAVKPGATPAQYKKALLDGVTFAPALAGVNGLPPRVRTSGIANAYAAVKNILHQFVKSDDVRHGNWRGFYGQQGAYVVGESTTFPSFVNASLDGVSPVILLNSTRAGQALQRISNGNDRIAAYGATGTTESINLTFTDGQAHRVGLYVADYDRRGRRQLVQIVDNTTGLTLDTQVVSNFAMGRYLFWDLQGSVQIKLTRQSGPSAVFSGIFFDAVPVNSNTFIAQDSATPGILWRNKFGSQGGWIVGDNNEGLLPEFVTSLTSTGNTKVLRSAINAPAALHKNIDVFHGIAAYWASRTSFDININVNDTLAHQITLYLADFERRGRTERIEVINPANGSVLFTQDVTNFSRGTFVTFNVTGNVTFRLSNKGGPNAVVSGVFFDAPPGEKVVFTGADTTTAGNWRLGGYGLTNAFVAGDNFPGIDVANTGMLTVNGPAVRHVLGVPVLDPRALLKVGFSVNPVRVAAYAQTNSSITLSLAIAANTQRQVALYFADFERFRRKQLVTISDPVTGQVLTRQRLAFFQNGKYLVFQVRGPVNITITSGAYPNAVISGLFVT